LISGKRKRLLAGTEQDLNDIKKPSVPGEVI